jgi:hypothetical protein
LSASNALKSYWFVIFPAIGPSIWSFLRYKKTENGRRV